MKTIAFVVLHYNVPDITRRCVASIRELDSNVKKKIVIVDNASPDGSGMLLQKEYLQDPDIKVLLNEKNEGFAKGNNTGYRYAREEWEADCIVIINNDIIFEQKDFILEVEKDISSWEKERVGVIGPDIVTVAQQHQNPFRERPYEIKDVKTAIRNKRIFLLYFHLKKILHLDHKIFILENLFEKRSEKRRNTIRYSGQQYGVVLQGACLIFSPLFVRKEKNAFCPDTFLYGEEDILSFQCRKREYQMLYWPSVSVRHLEGRATEERYSQPVKKSIFIYRNTLKSLGILKKMMESD